MKFRFLSILFFCTSLTFAQSIWKQLVRPFGGSIYSLAEVSDTLFIGTSDSGIWCFSEGDSTWHRIDDNKIINDVYSLKIDSANNLYAGCAGNVYKLFLKSGYGNDSTVTPSKPNDKKKWEVLTEKPKDKMIYSIDFTKDNNVVFGTNDGIYELNHNDSISTINNGLKNICINYLYIDKYNTFYAGTVSGIFRSTDSGKNWEEISNGLQNGNIRIITKSEKGLLYAATHGGGVYLFDSTKNKWTNISNNKRFGIPNPYISGLVCDNDGNLFASTYQFGVYYSKDNGRNWVKIGGDEFGRMIYSLFLSPNGKLYIGTFGSGVYVNDYFSKDSKKILGASVKNLIRSK